MSKWLTVAWYDPDCELTVNSELRGPFMSDTAREEAIDSLLIEENQDTDYDLVIVRFDIEGDGVPEVAT
jgi:hypothetical protein